MIKRSRDINGGDNTKLVNDLEFQFTEINRLSLHMECVEHNRDELFSKMLFIGISGHFLIQNAIVLEQINKLRSCIVQLKEYLDIPSNRVKNLNGQNWTWIQVFKAVNCSRSQVEINKNHFNPQGSSVYEIYFTNYFKHIENLEEELSNLVDEQIITQDETSKILDDTIGE